MLGKKKQQQENTPGILDDIAQNATDLLTATSSLSNFDVQLSYVTEHYQSDESACAECIY